MPDLMSLWQGFVLLMDSISLWVWYVLTIIVLVASVRWIGSLLIESHVAYDAARLADIETVAKEIQAVRLAIYDLRDSINPLLQRDRSDSAVTKRDFPQP
jgi:hypothetical protein